MPSTTRPRQVMSAINIPLSIMFPDILACRLILDLRDQGHEVSQPSIHIPAVSARAPSETSSATFGHGSPKFDRSSMLPVAYSWPHGNKVSGIRRLLGFCTSPAPTSNVQVVTRDFETQDSHDIADYAAQALTQASQTFSVTRTMPDLD